SEGRSLRTGWPPHGVVRGAPACAGAGERRRAPVCFRSRPELPERCREPSGAWFPSVTVPETSAPAHHGGTRCQRGRWCSVSHSPYPQWQPWQQGPGVPQPWAGQAGSPMLASHADRERAIDVLRSGYGEGRLEKTEFDRRVARAYAACTVGELALLVADLPQGPVPHAAVPVGVPPAFLPMPPRTRTNGKAVAAAVCGGLCLFTAGLTGIPAIILGHSAR